MFHEVECVRGDKTMLCHQGLYSLSGKTSYPKISWSLEAARFGFKLFQSLWNLAGTSAALLPRCLSNFRAIRPLQHPISRLRDFTRFGGKTSYRLVNRGPEKVLCWNIRSNDWKLLLRQSQFIEILFGKYTWWFSKLRQKAFILQWCTCNLLIKVVNGKDHHNGLLGKTATQILLYFRGRPKVLHDGFIVAWFIWCTHAEIYHMDARKT